MAMINANIIQLTLSSYGILVFTFLLLFPCLLNICIYELLIENAAARVCGDTLDFHLISFIRQIESAESERAAYQPTLKILIAFASCDVPSPRAYLIARGETAAAKRAFLSHDFAINENYFSFFYG